MKENVLEEKSTRVSVSRLIKFKDEQWEKKDSPRTVIKYYLSYHKLPFY